MTYSPWHLKVSLTRRLIMYVCALLLTQFLVLPGVLVVTTYLPENLTGHSKINDQIYRDTLRGTAYIIRKQLPQQSHAYQDTLKQLQSHFAYPLHLIPDSSPLPNTIRQQFAQDDLAYDSIQNILYVKLDSSQLLKMGPIIDSGTSLDTSFLLYLGLLWAIFSAVILMILLYCALSPLWRDALAIRNTAEQLAQGNMHARAPNVQSWLFKPLVSVLNDMTVQIEKQVHNSKTVSHAMAHELRTPLARLKFALSMLDEATTKEEYKSQRQGIDDDIIALESMINESLGLFRMQQQGLALHRIQVFLPEWLDSICIELARFTPDGFTLHAEAENQTVCFDIKIVRIAINNLLLNAFKYAHNRAEIHIKTHGQAIWIQVDDDGPGIPKESREKIFIPFARLDNSRSRTTGGYGLGLAYVKLIAESHHGSIHISTSPLGGCRFTIILDENK